MADFSGNNAWMPFFDGKGSFRRTFEFTGYGFLPSLVGSAITTITIPLSFYIECKNSQN